MSKWSQTKRFGRICIQMQKRIPSTSLSSPCSRINTSSILLGFLFSSSSTHGRENLRGKRKAKEQWMCAIRPGGFQSTIRGAPDKWFRLKKEVIQISPTDTTAVRSKRMAHEWLQSRATGIRVHVESGADLADTGFAACVQPVGGGRSAQPSWLRNLTKLWRFRAARYL